MKQNKKNIKTSITICKIFICRNAISNNTTQQLHISVCIFLI